MDQNKVKLSFSNQSTPSTPSTPSTSSTPIAYSPCPNDTFIFHAWVSGLIQPPSLFAPKPILADIQQLNEWLLQKKHPVTKASISCYPYVQEDYCLLPVGAALGVGCGPKIIAKKKFDVADIRTKTIAVPGKNTTANFLLDTLLNSPQKKHYCHYADVVKLIRSGDVDCGLIIHETRFTFEAEGLVDIIDLGDLWENKYRLPLPLGGIFALRSLGEKTIQNITLAIQQSLMHAREHPNDSIAYILQHSQEKDPVIVQKHIDLYVNKETYQLSTEGRASIDLLLNLAKSRKLCQN